MKEIKPIAYFRSPLTSKFGIPRQSGLADNLVGKIVFEPQYQREEALRGLEEFDYLWLIWGFSANKSTDDGKLTVRPPRLGGNERLGVFATRSPFRPNGLGLSSVRIKRITDGAIEVSGADLMDGTPIYDVKPYIPTLIVIHRQGAGLLIRKHGKNYQSLLQRSILRNLIKRRLRL